MKQTRLVMAVIRTLGIVWGLALHGGDLIFAQEGKIQIAQATTRTIIGDLLDVDRDFYIVRGERGEIRIEATGKTKITEEFGYGDRIKAVVLPNDKALIIERAGSQDIPGVTENVAVTSSAQQSETPKAADKAKTDLQITPAAPNTKTIIGDLLDVDGDFYVVRGKRGEIRIEATPETHMTEALTFGDRIKATVSMTDTAFSIERAGPGDAPGVIVHRAASSEEPKAKSSKPSPSAQKPEPSKPKSPPAEAHKPDKASDTRMIEGQILMIDGDFYVLRGEQGEIRIEVTPETTITEEFKFGDHIKATVRKNDKALVIERTK